MILDRDENGARQGMVPADALAVDGGVAHLRTAMDLLSLGDAVLAIDNDQRVIYWGGGAERLYGVSGGEALGRQLEDVCRCRWPRPEDEAAAHAALSRTGTWRGVNIHVLPTGEERHMESSVSVLRDGLGEQVGLLAVIRDVTGRWRTEEALRGANERLAAQAEDLQVANEEMQVQAEELRTQAEELRAANERLQDRAEELRLSEEALRASEGKLRIVADFTYDWEYWRASDGRCVYMSPSCERITGYTREEFMADPGLFTRIVHPEDRDRADVNAPAHQVAGVHELEFRIITRGGETRWIHHYCTPIIDEAGTRLGRRASNRDVTDRRRMDDALREADRRKDEFLAMLAHELRNPLAAISNAIRLMRVHGPGDPVLERARDAAERQTRHMGRLLDDLLDVSRVTEGKIALKREGTDLASVVLSAVETVYPLVEENRHELSVSLPPEPVQVNGDPVRLAQVAANLLGNAAKYTPPGGSISVSLHREGDEAVIRVCDNGIGISRDILPHVFDLFVQEDTSLGRERGGLGIGLTMVRALVGLHGGRVEVRSEGPGKGSEFVVVLPFQQAEHGARGSAAGGLPSETASSCAVKRVLVVDDNADGAEILAMTLEAEGHEAITAHDGPSAIRLTADKRPDVVLLDIGMPGMDGYEVARRLRQEMGSSCPVLVALTGYGHDDHRERARAAGFDHHLVKPAKIEVLQEIVAGAPGR